VVVGGAVVPSYDKSWQLRGQWCRSTAAGLITLAAGSVLRHSEEEKKKEEESKIKEKFYL